MLVLVLLLWLLVAERDKIAGSWEIQNGALGFLPAWLLAAAVPGAFGALYVAPRTPPWVRAGISFVLCSALAVGVSSGRHFASVPVRVVFVAALGGLGAGVGLVFGRFFLPHLRRLSAGAPGRLALAWGGVALLLELANRLVLVRLYPAFHAGLSFASLAIAGAGCALATGRAGRPPGRRSLVVLSILLVLGAGLVPAARHVRGFDNFRWVVGSAPTLAWGLDVTRLVAPPPPVDPQAQAAPLGSLSDSRGVSFRGRSILLVTVDALRADHVGAYGYGRPTTPAIDHLAREGTLFLRAYAPTPHTSYSVTSLLTGKYMRPLLLQGAGQDSDLLAGLLSTYGYKTAGFYPPAVFFIDTDRFSRFSRAHLGFEYFKVEFAEGTQRIEQIRAFLSGQPEDQPVFVWLHLFGPHEPYEDQPDFDFGRRDVDRYDEEIAEADRTIGEAVSLLRRRDPRLLTLVSADHGEEFGDHGGRYHGTTVYEEQVRVPLVVQGEGLPAGRVIRQPVQTIDLLPTLLSGLSIPVPPRVRGRDLTPLLAPESKEPDGAPGLALAETDDFVMLAEERWRLVCQRRAGACQLFDIVRDPAQKRNVSRESGEVLARLKERARALAASHGELEASGLRAEGRGWPEAIVRGISGDADAAPELAQLLDDADPDIRAKSAEVLFGIARTSEAPALRLALSREEDPRARAFLALTLTRLGQGAPLVHELLTGDDLHLSRLAAVALAEQDVDDGEMVLLRWWLAGENRSFEEDKQIALALQKIGSEKAVSPLLRRLSDVRLRPFIAAALAAIGDDDAAPFLAKALAGERYQSTRPALAEALLALGAEEQLVLPLRHFLGVPDPMPDGVGIARRAGILQDVGGPSSEALARLTQLSSSGVDVAVVVPPLAKSLPFRGVQVVVRARAMGEGRRILLAQGVAPAPREEGEGPVFRHQPEISMDDAVAIELEGGAGWQEKRVILPPSFGAKPGHQLGLAVFTETGVELSALVAVPLRDEIPPPPPEPWEGAAERP